MQLNLNTKENVHLSFLDTILGYRYFAVIRPSIADNNYSYKTCPEITDLSVKETGELTLKTKDISADATVIAAIYAENDIMLSSQRLTLISGKANALFSIDSAVEIKAFVWDNMKPLTAHKSIFINE